MKNILPLSTFASVLALVLIAGCYSGDGGGPEGTSTIEGTVSSFAIGNASYVPQGMPGILCEVINFIVPDAEAGTGGVGVHMVGTDLSTTTDDYGYFIMSGAPAGRHQLQFIFNEQTSVLDVDVPEDGTLTLSDIRCTGQQTAKVGRMSVQMNSHSSTRVMSGSGKRMDAAGM